MVILIDIRAKDRQIAPNAIHTIPTTTNVVSVLFLMETEWGWTSPICIESTPAYNKSTPQAEQTAAEQEEKAGGQQLYGSSQFKKAGHILIKIPFFEKTYHK